MIQVLGRPILAYVLDRCKQAGLSRIVIVVSPHSTVVQDYFGDGSQLGLHIEYVVQPSPQGIGHAVGLTEGVVETPFAVYLGDELYLGSDHRGFIESFEESGASAAVGLIRVDDETLIRRNYSVDMDDDTRIIRHLVEKPKTVTNNILGCGSYIFDDSVFEAIRRTPKSAKNEIEITDTLNTLTAMGRRVVGYFLGGTYLNITYPEDISLAEKLLRSAGVKTQAKGSPSSSSPICYSSHEMGRH